MTCERIDSELLEALGESGEPAGDLAEHLRGCDACRARLRTYHQLTAMIAVGATERALPPAWRERTMARVRASRTRPTRRAPVIAAAAVAAASAIILLVWWRTRVPAAPELDRGALAIQIAGGPVHRGDGHPGQELHIEARGITAPHAEIRVYRGGVDLLVRCPSAGPPTCRPDGSAAWTIPAPGRYQIVLISAAQAIADPRGSMEDDIAAARASTARIVEVQTLDVR